MPWTTPSLRTVREMVRNDVTASLQGAVMVANSVLRVMSDAMAGTAHLVLRYIDWLSLQLLPDTAETEWLDRHGDIWLINADGTTGRKAAAYAHGSVTITGQQGFTVPIATPMSALGVNYETTQEVTLGTSPTNCTVRALNSGTVGNLVAGDTMDFTAPIAGIDSTVTVVSVDGGTDTETDDQLRSRILFRIQNPPMGGDAADYVIWATSVPGVTRAWAAPEMGPGTMTVRFMMDDLRQDNHGLPNGNDCLVVQDYINTVRPVTVKDLWALGPVPLFYNVVIKSLVNNTPDVQNRILASVLAMEKEKSKPGQTMYRSWVDEAISETVGVDHFELEFDTLVMPDSGYMPFVGTIYYA